MALPLAAVQSRSVVDSGLVGLWAEWHPSHATARNGQLSVSHTRTHESMPLMAFRRTPRGRRQHACAEPCAGSHGANVGGDTPPR